MCDCEKQTTDQFLAVRYPNIGGSGSKLKDWLEQLNENVGWLKQHCSGNAMMQVLWGGGVPGNPEWLVKLGKKPGGNKART